MVKGILIRALERLRQIARNTASSSRQQPSKVSLQTASALRTVAFLGDLLGPPIETEAGGSACGDGRLHQRGGDPDRQRGALLRANNRAGQFRNALAALAWKASVPRGKYCLRPGRQLSGGIKPTHRANRTSAGISCTSRMAINFARGYSTVLALSFRLSAICLVCWPSFGCANLTLLERFSRVSELIPDHRPPIFSGIRPWHLRCYLYFRAQGFVNGTQRRIKKPEPRTLNPERSR